MNTKKKSPAPAIIERLISEKVSLELSDVNDFVINKETNLPYSVELACRINLMQESIQWIRDNCKTRYDEQDKMWVRLSDALGDALCEISGVLFHEVTNSFTWKDAQDFTNLLKTVKS